MAALVPAEILQVVAYIVTATPRCWPNMPIIKLVSLTAPVFIIPKIDLGVLPQWINNYRELNANTVPDNHLLPCVDDILVDCTRGRIWGKIDMTNTFFQTRVHPDNIT